MRRDGVVGGFPSQKFAIELGKGERARSDSIEPLPVGAEGTFDLAVEFGRARGQDPGQDKEAQTALRTGFLEDGGELTACPPTRSEPGSCFQR